MNNIAASIAYVGSGTYIAAIAALCFLLILFCYITICVLAIRKQVHEINRRLNKLIALIEIKEKVRRKLVANKQKLKLDDNDIEKLKSLGVGME